jgi:hypothetical protein
MDKKILVILVVYLTIIGWSNAHFTTEDSAIHAQSIELVKDQLYLLTYEPITNIKFTYPPFFYYIGSFMTFFSLSALQASQILGLLSFILFPISVYFLTKIWNIRAAIFAAIASTVSSSITIVFIFSQYPQILAFDFLVLGLYFYFSKKYKLSGVLFGFSILTHSFVGFTTFFLLIFLLIFRFAKDRNNLKDVLKTISITFLVSLFWIYQYYLILLNMFGGTWNNVRWYSIQGFGFVSIEGFWNMILRINPFIFFVSIFGLYILLIKKHIIKKEYSLTILLLFFLCLGFNIYHFPPAQYKFLDLWIIPVVVLFGIGCDEIIKNFRVDLRLSLIYIIILILAVSGFFPIFEISKYHSNFSAINQETVEAAIWLKSYDNEKSRILLTINSSKKYKENLNFNSELIFSQLSNKIPLDGTISDLEAYTEEYKKQLEDREKLIQNFSLDLAEKYKIKYIITDNCPLKTEEIYSKEGIKLCSIQ